MRAAETAGVNAVPDLVFEETARYQRRLPDGFWRRAILDQEMRQRDRRIEVDHRSSRSCFRSCMSCRSVMTGLRGGEPPPVSAGGVSHPSRTPSASNASATNGLRPAWGGTISATTRSRSVTRTVSPLAARRTYSLSLFLSTFRPTERMPTKVATGSYLVNAPAFTTEGYLDAAHGPPAGRAFASAPSVSSAAVTAACPIQHGLTESAAIIVVALILQGVMGLSQRKPRNRAKSPSVEQRVSPCSTASAARRASGTRLPWMPGCARN